MRVLILGGQGMLGHKLFQVLASRFQTYATFRNGDGLWRHFPMYGDSRYTIGGVDALHFDSIVEVMAEVRPDVVINSIGIIKQLDEKKSPTTLITVNALFPHRLHTLCRAAGSRLIQISTDCVFSGEAGNYDEDDLPDPVDTYGRTKLLGEVEGPGALTLRTSVIGRDYVKDVGLLEWFLGNRGRRIQGYSGAIYSGFTTRALAHIISDLIADFPSLSGLYHVASRPLSKLELLIRIRDAAELDVEIVADDSVQCDRSLNPARFVEETGYDLPSWEEMIRDLVPEIDAYDQWRTRHEFSR